VTLEEVADLTDIGVGEVQPTPIMRWLEERGGPSERFSPVSVVASWSRG